jgi:hypothetical protein
MTSVALSLLQNNKTTSIGTDLYDTLSPKFSFFKYVLRRNTNFFSTHINICNETINLNNLDKLIEIDIKKQISGDVDLLNNLYISFYLPDIYSNDKYKFKWVENIGAILIKEAIFTINGQDIDSLTGEWLCVWNELSSPVVDDFNKMAGNIPEINNPKSSNNIIRIKNNIINDFDYPSSDMNNPSIPGKWVSVQLPFWFTKAPNLALPIFGAVWSENTYYLKITFTNIEKLYTVYSDIYNMNISPSHYNSLYNEQISILNFTKKDTVPLLKINIIATCIILDISEKTELANNCFNGIEYLYESFRILNNSYNNSITGNIVINIPPKFLINKIIWTLKRSDSLTNFNDALNYSYSIPFNNEKSIMKAASITWRNSNTYLEENGSFYFNQIQPYQYFKTIPKQGIYLYSFSLLPDKSIHSGSYNSSSSSIDEGMKINMSFNNYEPSILDKMWEKKFNRKYIDNYTVNIDNTLYLAEYNFLIILNNIIKKKYVN